MNQFASLTHLKSRLEEEWLIGLSNQALVELAVQRWQELVELQSAKPNCSVLLAESDPVAFLAGFIAATTASATVFLGNPNWSAGEWQQVFQQVTPDRIWGNVPSISCDAPPLRSDAAGWLLIPTGGSSGKIRFAIHTWETLSASVDGFRHYFAVEKIHSCCVLPLYHVSGLMQFLRSFLTGGTFAVFPYSQIEQSFNLFDPTNFFLSLVPTQLQHLMENPVGLSWLKAFKTVFLGGAPAWPNLLETARSHQIRLAPTYGMTETAAQIATLKPQDFLQGKTGCGKILPHAEIKVHANETTAFSHQLHQSFSKSSVASPEFISSKAAQIGPIAIHATSLTLGYFPHPTHEQEFLTDDLGYIDREGYLYVVGRNSQKIITGGENVFPAEVEAAIRATGLVLDVCVIGMPDQTWGEKVTSVCVPGSPEVTVTALKAAIAPHLSKFKQPKQWFFVNQIPRNAQGKLNYARLKQFLEHNQTHIPLLPRTAPWVDAELETQPNSQ